MKLSVVIVNYNVKFYLQQCLESLLKALEGVESEVFVVDNNSHDSSVSYLSELFTKVNFIPLNHNFGFSRANNIAIRNSESEYVLLLNPDTFVAEDCIKEVLSFMDSHPKAGGVGVMMHNIDGSKANESRRAVPSPVVSMMKMFGRSQRYYMSHLSWDKPEKIEVMSGAFCMLRRKALQEVGLLDEDFFMYGEDIDLSYRLLQGGWENWYVPAHILHYKGESTHKTTFRYVHVFYQAMLIFFRKHYGHLSLLVFVPIKAAIYLRALVALIQMQYQRFRKWLGVMRQNEIQTSYILVGTDTIIKDCKKRADMFGLSNIVLLPTDRPCVRLEDLPPAKKNLLYFAVFDTSLFAYKDILQTMQDIGRYDVRVATFNPKSGRIITPYDVF